MPASEVKLAHKVSSTSDYSVTQKCSGNTVLDGNFHLLNHNSLDLSLHTYSDLKQGDKSSWNNRVLVRAHLPDLIASAGFVDFDLVNHRVPSQLNLSLLKGKKCEECSVWGGFNAFYNVNSKHLNNVALLAVLRNKQLSLHLEPSVKRTLKDDAVVNELSNRVLATYKCHDKVNTYLDWSFNATSLEHKVAVASDYQIDDKTVAKVKYQNNNTVSFAFRRLFGSFVNFSFNTQVQINRAASLGNEQQSTPLLSFRLGAQVELKE